MLTPTDPQWFSESEAPRVVNSADDLDWDGEADTVVVGFGAAGACAAIEAAEKGASVIAIDRFKGGGATAQSGGIVYAGGGTEYQQEAGYDDSAKAMFNYLKLETAGVVSDATLRTFCEDSVEMLAWLEDKGVEFNAAMSPVKTSYPGSRSFLYYSGNEEISEYAAKAQPAPRGHRVFGRGQTGAILFQRLQRAAIEKGVETRYQSKVKRLVVDSNGSVVGVEISYLPEQGSAAKQQRLLNYFMKFLRLPLPKVANKLRQKITALEQGSAAKPALLRARKGVILAAGGFVFNREMVQAYAPSYLPALPLGDTGCDGSGIRLGQTVGGDTALMNRVSAWRFINPPLAWAKGMVVNAEGQRYCNEMVYGAKLGHHMMEENNKGKAIIVINHTLFWAAVKEVMPWKIWLFQSVPALINLFLNARKADTIEALAARCDIPEDALAKTLHDYNRATVGEVNDPQGKPQAAIHGMFSGPYYAMDVSVDSPLFPCPTLTLGGLVVDEASGAVKREDGELISGLFAAGRNAVGVASNHYVSGLSIADCIFSGRRAGRSVSS